MDPVTRAKIQTHIQDSGYHLYIVSTKESPRYAYTIGLKERIGYELCFLGALFFDVNEVEEIFASLSSKLIKEGEAKIEVQKYGIVELRDVRPDWVSELFFGALDFHGEEHVVFKQVYLNEYNAFIDVPNCSLPLEDSLWSKSKYADYKSYTTVVNKEVLNSEPVLEVMRWEPNEWEMFSYAGPDVPKNDLRIVPLKVCLLADESLINSLKLAVGKGAWREKRSSMWNAWG
mgnify:CR=1 FL=1